MTQDDETVSRLTEEIGDVLVTGRARFDLAAQALGICVGILVTMVERAFPGKGKECAALVDEAAAAALDRMNDGNWPPEPERVLQ